MTQALNTQRIIIEGVLPQIDNGQFPIKRIENDWVQVRADIFADGHDEASANIRYRKIGAKVWSVAPMTATVNDRWQGKFQLGELGRYEYTVSAWVDHYKTWVRDLGKKRKAGQDISLELLDGSKLIERAANYATEGDKAMLSQLAIALADETSSEDQRYLVATDPENCERVQNYPDPKLKVQFDKILEVVVDLPIAQFSAWYEMFPRSANLKEEKHGTFRDVEAWLPYIAKMGFDILYFPPIHPIGTEFRKGPNNTLDPSETDPGSPWAIGSAEGGHTAIHSELGTLEDFNRLRAKAEEHGLQLALDIAFQCAPDHPWVTEHPEWFKHRADGSIQYAENPPKKYQDIYPFDFEGEKTEELWQALKGVFEYWIEQDVKIFRVDNPHTKPFTMWDWIISELKAEHPEVIFLAEAFTRPKIMARLAKGGFSQSYTYFTWRRHKWEIMEYMTELTRTEKCEYYRPNFWPNTPDILTDQLQTGNRGMFMARLAMAATLTANYGMYGPSFELMEHVPRKGAEEYIDSEKYQLRHWDLQQPHSLKDFIARINQIRKDNPALQSNASLQFHDIENDALLGYSKRTIDGSNVLLIVVNIDCEYMQAGSTRLDLDALGLHREWPFEVHDLLTNARYSWQGERNYVELNPSNCPVHIFRVASHWQSDKYFYTYHDE